MFGENEPVFIDDRRSYDNSITICRHCGKSYYTIQGHSCSVTEEKHLEKKEEAENGWLGL